MESMNWLINVSVGVLILVGLLFWHSAAARNGSKLWAGVAYTLLIIIFLAIGERYWNVHHHMPFFFGFGSAFDQRQDVKPLAFLIVIGMVIPFLLSWSIRKGCDAYTTSTKMPGTLKASFVGIIFCYFVLQIGGAYLGKWSGISPATTTLTGVKEAAIVSSQATHDLLLEDDGITAPLPDSLKHKK